MQYKIEYSSLANKSLNEIYDYIAEILLEPKTAQNIVFVYFSLAQLTTSHGMLYNLTRNCKLMLT